MADPQRDLIPFGLLIQSLSLFFKTTDGERDLRLFDPAIEQFGDLRGHQAELISKRREAVYLKPSGVGLRRPRGDSREPIGKRWVIVSKLGCDQHPPFGGCKRRVSGKDGGLIQAVTREKLLVADIELIHIVDEVVRKPATNRLRKLGKPGKGCSEYRHERRTPGDHL